MNYFLLHFICKGGFLYEKNKFIKIVFSDKQNGDFNKIIIKPLLLKSGKNIQIESFKENKAFHKNNNKQHLK